MYNKDKTEKLRLLTVIHTISTKIVHNLLVVDKREKTPKINKKVDNVNNFVDNC